MRLQTDRRKTHPGRAFPVAAQGFNGVETLAPVHDEWRLFK